MATIKQIIGEVREMGLTCRWIAETKEFRINFRPENGGTEDSAAYTDRDDAVNTARAMAAWKAETAETAETAEQVAEVEQVASVSRETPTTQAIPANVPPIGSTVHIRTMGTRKRAVPHTIAGYSLSHSGEWVYKAYDFAGWAHIDTVSSLFS